MLLERAAYDKLNSLKAIDTTKLEDIEAYLLEHRSSWINDLSCCKSEDYKKQTKFHFLPGHKSIVLTIPEQIKQMRGVKESEFVSTKKNHAADGLTTKLISNLMTYMKKNNFALPDGLMSSKNIRDFERGAEVDDFVCECRFVCPFCPKNFPITYRKFWMSSNLTKHLKNHIDIENLNVQNNQNV